MDYDSNGMDEINKDRNAATNYSRGMHSVGMGVIMLNKHI